MRHLPSSLASVAILAVGAFAHTVDDVTPSSGSVGTAITITGTGFGTKTPAVFLTSPETGTKKFKLKVTSHDDTSIVATVLKGVVGTFDVNVKVGPLTVTMTDALSLLAPSITPGQATTADVGTSVELDGSNFGTKQGKLVAGGKKATVLSWTDTAITFTVPASIPNGPVVVGVTNALGSDAIPDDLTVTGSSTPLGTNKVTGSIGSKSFKPLIHFIFINGNNWTLQMTELGKHARSLSFALFDLGTLPGVFHGTETTPATLALAIGGGGGDFAAVPGEFTITITHQEANKFAGVISGEVTGDGNVKIAIHDVEFIWNTGI